MFSCAPSVCETMMLTVILQVPMMGNRKGSQSSLNQLIL
jgi:hypothetical protein